MIRFRYQKQLWEIPDGAAEKGYAVMVVLSEAQAITILWWKETPLLQPGEIRSVNVVVSARNPETLQKLLGADYIAIPVVAKKSNQVGAETDSYRRQKMKRLVLKTPKPPKDKISSH